MEPASVAEQRATAVAKLKRAASLPRMKDGRRPPMHVEAVSEGERAQADDKPDEDSAQESEEGKPEPEVEEKTPIAVVEGDIKPEPAGEDKVEEGPPPERSTTPNKKRRSRSRTRSRGSKDFRNKPKPTIITNTTESSADECYPSAAGEDAPPSPPLISPIPSHFAGLPTSRLLRSPLTPHSPIYYPGTAPSTPMLPTLDDIRKYGLYRSNSAGAARAMAMQKLIGEPVDMGFASSSPTPPPFGGLTRNNTVAGGERIAARNMMLNRLNGRIKGADGDQTSGGEEAPPPVTPPSSKRRRRRSRRASSRASGILDDRDDREPTSTSPNTPLHPPSPAPTAFGHTPDRPWTPGTQHLPQAKQQQVDMEAPMGGRGIVVEDEDEDLDRSTVQKPYANLPSTPRLRGPRLPHTSDAPSGASVDSAAAPGEPVPVFMSSNGNYKPDAFPTSPFATPLKERLGDGEMEEDEESETYRELRNRSASRNAFERDSEISWVAEPVPRMPIHDDDDDSSDEDEEAEAEPGPPTPEPGRPVEQVAEHRGSESYDEPSSSASHTSHTIKEDIDEPQASSAPVAPHMPHPSAPGLTLSTQGTNDRVPPPQPPSPVYPMRLSVATPTQFDRSPSTTEFPDWEENRAPPAESTPSKHNETAWERIKGALFTRSTSSNGRRSRTNSIGARERRYNTESSVSRESGASLTNVKAEKRESSGPFANQQNQSFLMQTPSASASILSLPPAISPGGTSPIPPASAADLTKYADSKLAPFPGMKQLQEQRRAKALLSASSPDIVLATNGIEAVQSSGSSSSATTRSPEVYRERKLSHQMSDSRLLAKFSPPVLTSATSGASHTDYFSVPQMATTTTPPVSANSSLKLPMNREGVKRWLSAKKLFSSQSSSSQAVPITPVSPNVAEPRPRQPTKKPSFSDLLKARKDNETPWDELNDNSRTPTSAPNGGQVGKFIFKEDMKQTEVRVDIEHIVHDTNHSHTPPSKQANGRAPVAPPTLDFINFSPVFSSFPSPPDPPSSVTPDPQSSLDEFPTRSTSESFSSMSSSRHSPNTPNPVPSKFGLVMERLDEILGRGSKSSLWVQPIDDPPRKLLLSSPVLQVSNANTVKDRFLFLFTDIMIIAKPIMHENDVLLETSKPNPSDRKFIVKNVVMLRDLKVSGERDESRVKLSSHTSTSRHPFITSFVRQFGKDPDHAVSELFSKVSSKNDPVALGQLIQRSIDLDRVRVGEYLVRRSSKSVLRAYVDAFEFTGLRIDKALRAFLLSIWIPPTPGAQEHLLDSFASRWYDANAGIVAFDKDQAVRLVRSISQLNEVMHGGVAQTAGITPYPRRNVISKDFVEAFKRPDPRCLVPDELLDKVYVSIRRERLAHARNLSAPNASPDIPITMKRPIPPRLTYRLQSEPVVLRIPQPDPQLTIQLFGQDLVFDPPVLTFLKSAEASFRVTGTSLGPKTIIMWRTGPNALLYSSLPLSSPVVVERSFMRYTFQFAFPNHRGVKRKYMFSVDDSVIRHQWVENIKHQIDVASAGPGGPKTADTASPSAKSYEAAEVVAFKVLQDTLIQPDIEESLSPDAVNHALARLANGHNGVPNGHLDVPEGTPRRRRVSSHGRSKSRSQVYHRHGAGKLEPELNDDDDNSSPALDESSGSGPHSRADVKMWSVHELTVICRQNSSIAPVLAYFQMAGTDSNTVTS